jgi:plasmid stabilization system protein ParE
VKSIVHFRPDAESDVTDAAAWYETQRAGLGAEFLDEILETCNTIAENPQIYPLLHRETRRAVMPLYTNFHLEFTTGLKTDW